MRNKLHIDDSLDVFAVHGMGGILGIILVAIFADSAFGGSGLNRSMFQQLIVQLIGIATVVIWSAILTYLIAWTVRAMVGMRVSEKEEAEGSDLFTHGESNYHS
jgi:Amt family ammonium transporter